MERFVAWSSFKLMRKFSLQIKAKKSITSEVSKTGSFWSEEGKYICFDGEVVLNFSPF